MRIHLSHFLIAGLALGNDFEEDPGCSCTLTEGALNLQSDLLVVPDIHGDFDALKGLLSRTRLVQFMTDSDTQEKSWQWVGGRTSIVQTGDIFDRGPDTNDILLFFDQLEEEMQLHGACMFRILGNHEDLNLKGQFHYASAKETEGFGGLHSRKNKLAKTHPLGQYLRELPMVLKLNTTLFAHAGLRLHVLSYFGNSLETLNHRVKKSFFSSVDNVSNRHLFGEEGPVWTRFFATESAAVCAEISKVLQIVGAERMVVGHTVQWNKWPGILCDGKIVLSDIGMSKFYGGSEGAKFVRIRSNVLQLV